MECTWGLEEIDKPLDRFRFLLNAFAYITG